MVRIRSRRLFHASLIALCLSLTSPIAAAVPKTRGAVSQSFVKLDSDLDGQISRQEFYKKKKSTKGDLLFEQVDRDKDQFLSLEEFLAYFVKKK